MDQRKIGLLLLHLRRQKELTQKQLAQQIGVSDKTISKWERGQGCPDLSTLPHLSSILGVPMEALLSGQLPEPDSNGGNMKKTNFYVCPKCGNVITASGSPSLSCCGRVLEPCAWQKPDESHTLHMEEVDGEWFLTTSHPMTKEHSIAFTALVTSERMTLVRHWPEWDLQVRLPKRGHGILYWYCTCDGLFRQII